MQIPKPSNFDSSCQRIRYYDYSYRTKYNYDSLNRVDYTTYNSRINLAGTSWYYTYSGMHSYDTRAIGSRLYTGFIQMTIHLENDGWSGKYGGSTTYFPIYTYRNTNRYLATYPNRQTGTSYTINLIFGLDKDIATSRYGASGTQKTYAQIANDVVSKINEYTSRPELNYVGINTLSASVVNNNRIKLLDATGNTVDFLNTGTGPFRIETPQTSGIVDDYYTISGFTSTTVSIASSARLASRELEFNQTGIVSETNSGKYYINIPTGHGIADGQKLVYHEVSGSSIPGITSGTTYYTIATNNKYLELATSENNYESGIGSITAGPSGSGEYKLIIPSISGRVAAAGNVALSEDSKTVTGTNTRFTSSYSVGDNFVIAGLGSFDAYTSNTIESIVGDTTLSLSNNAGITTTSIEHYVDTKLNVRADGTFIHRPFDGGVEITAGSSPNSKIIRQTRKYFRYQSGKGIQCSMAINFNPYRPAGSVVSGGTGTSQTVTVTTEYPHGLTPTDQIKFRGSNDAGYNGTFTITQSTTFTFTYVSGSIVGLTTTSPAGFMEYTINTYNNAAIRAGLFDDQNGFFFEYDGSTLYAVRRSSTQQLSGTVVVANGSNSINGSNTKFLDQLSDNDYVVIRGQTYLVTKVHSQTKINIQPKYRGTSNNGIILTKTIDTKVAQDNWNIDKADGSGPSGYILDINSIQMAYLDYSWYGAGKIRFGFKDTYGHVKYMHEFIHNNKLNEAYMRTGNVPARYEVTNTSILQPSFVPSLFHWGTSVIMDGGFDNDDSYLFTASGKSLTFTNGTSSTANTNGNSSIYRQRYYGSFSYYYLRIPFNSSDASKFTNGIPLYYTDGDDVKQLDGDAVSFTAYSGSTFYVYIYLSSGYQQPASYPIIESASTINIGAPSGGAGNVDLNSLLPLISIRLSPSADNNLIGELGERDIINRMQLKMQEMGISVSHDARINVVLNGSLSNLTYENVGSPSLSQYISHNAGDTIEGGTIIYQFRASGGAIGASGERTVSSETFDLSRLIDLGNSILGGDGVFPNGPDIITIAASVLDTTNVDQTAPFQVSSRISWAESQA